MKREILQLTPAQQAFANAFGERIKTGKPVTLIELDNIAETCLPHLSPDMRILFLASMGSEIIHHRFSGWQSQGPKKNNGTAYCKK